MKRFLLLLTIFCTTLPAFAQSQFVKWTYKAEKTAPNEYILRFDGVMEPKWHVYSQKQPSEDGPLPTVFTFDANKNVQFIGGVSESGEEMHDDYEPMFDMKVKYFSKKVRFSQKVKVTADTKLSGYFDYQACDDTRCIFEQGNEFSFDLKADGSSSNADPKIDTVISPQPKPVDTVQGSVPDTGTSLATAAGTRICDNPYTGFTGGYFGEPLEDCGTQLNVVTIWDAIIKGFLFGFLALLTPCVFPMIPLTVSFFVKRAEDKTKGRTNALLYAASITLIYFLLSLPFVLFGASGDALNEFATGALLNVIFFIIFVVFAISFFGYYDISLPSFISNKADSASNVGGVIGIFFMAVTLAVVSFSCTGPLLGTLLGSLITDEGAHMKLMVGMTAFGLALALPFALFAFFPSLLSKIPKSGGWMDTFKVFLGFLELIFAVKFLSSADMVKHWGLLKRETFLVIWAILGLLMFFYMIGMFRFKKEYDEPKFSFGKLGIGLIGLAFSAYCFWGFLGNDTKLFSGLVPPKFYSISHCEGECPLELNCHHDYCEALEAAKRENKPILIDFTGWACVNCRKMEENVWSKPEVFDIINEKYVLLSLYVDDKTPLEESKQYRSEQTGKKMRSVGNLWSDFENVCFKQSTQPYYVLITPDERLLNAPRGYTPDAEEFKQFLECGHAAFKKHYKK